MMESTIGGVLLDVWFKGGGQQKTMAATSNFILSKFQIQRRAAARTLYGRGNEPFSLVIT